MPRLVHDKDHDSNHGDDRDSGNAALQVEVMFNLKTFSQVVATVFFLNILM